MMGRRTILLFLVAGALGMPVQAQERCGVGKDLIVQTLERVHPGSNASTMQDGVELLKHAISTCPTLGDAWYYRSLLERRLGNTRLADYALTKAQDNNSEAYQLRLDPFTLSTNPNAPPVGRVSEKWALVIGISKFKQRTIPPLGSPAKDATAFAELLTNPKVGRFKASNVVTLTNSQATTRAIKEKLNWLARVADPNDLVVVYIATHGSPRKMDTAGANYIVTYDTDLGPDFKDQDALFSTGLAMQEVASVVASRVRAQRTAIIVDTCFSGATTGASGLMAGGTSIPSDALDVMKQGTGRVVLAASQGDEKSLESDILGHGLFTYYLIEALKRDQGLDPIGKIYPYVRQQVSEHAQASNKTQTPMMAQSEQGDQIVIGVPPQGAAAGGGS